MSIQEDLASKRKRAHNPFVIREGKFRDAPLEDSFYHLDWAEESFLSGDHEKEMLRRTFDLSKLKYIIGLVTLAMIIILIRVFWLQVVRGGHYYSMAEGNRIRAEIIEPRRGIIYDCNFRPLVRNEANFLLYLVPNDLPRSDVDRDNLLRQISVILDGPSFDGDSDSKTAAPQISQVGDLKLISETPSFYEIKDKLDKIKLNSLEAYQPLFITDNIEYQKALALYVEAEKTPGVFVSNKIRRNYLTGLSTSTPVEQVGATSLAHVLGYTGKISESELKELKTDYSLIDYIGKTGLEYSYEADLKGKNGEKDIEVDALGRPKKIVSQSVPEDGHNLLLSLDAELQKQVEDSVRNMLGKLGKTRASAIVMNPQTGEILALLSWPAYDNNVFAKGISQTEYSKFLQDSNRPLFNRVVAGEFPAGSTIKPVMAAAALEEKIINENTTINSNGGIRISEWTFPDWKAGGHGLTNVKKALAESVNTFFYYIGGGYDNFKGLGIDKIVKYFKLFWLGQPTGIDLPSEGTGFVPTPAWKEEAKDEVWYIGDTYHVSIGQGDVSVTPLQVANYTAFFANGGKLYKPHLVKQVLDSQNQVIKDMPTEVLATGFVSPQNIEIVRAGLRQTVLSGSARSLNSLSVPIAGKTGTAQWSTRHQPQAWFTGFAPYDNPQIVVTILVEEGGEGSAAATPIAKEIFDWYFKNRLNK